MGWRVVVLALVLIAAPARAGWYEARSAHFVIYSDGKPDQLRAFAEELERFDAGMRVLRGVPATTDSPNNRLTVFLVESVATIRKLGGGANVVGFYDGRVGDSVAFVPRRTGSGDAFFGSELVLRHEYAHHFMFRNYPAAYPAWFIEGFAEFSSTARIQPDGAIDFGLPARHRAWEVLEGDNVPVERLLAADRRSQDIASIYGRGWLLTHYLTFAKERRGQLGRYLTAINAGTAPLAAARAAFGDLRQLDRELDRYVRSRTSYYRIPAARLAPGPIEVRALSAGANAIMPIHLRSRRGVGDKAAAALVIEARRAAAPFPDDPFVQTALAEAEIDAGHAEAAEAAAARALAADPQSVRALVFRGRAAVARLVAAGSTDPAAWKAARQWFVTANRIEPTAPAPLLHYATSFDEQQIPRTANAAAALYGAAELAPESGGLRLLVARQRLSDGDVAAARTVLGPVAYDPHGGETARFAAALIAVLDAAVGQAPADWATLDRAARALLSDAPGSAAPAGDPGGGTSGDETRGKAGDETGGKPGGDGTDGQAERSSSPPSRRSSSIFRSRP
jgi:hypothetical protein